VPSARDHVSGRGQTGCWDRARSHAERRLRGTAVESGGHLGKAAKLLAKWLGKLGPGPGRENSTDPGLVRQFWPSGRRRKARRPGPGPGVRAVPPVVVSGTLGHKGKCPWANPGVGTKWGPRVVFARRLWGGSPGTPFGGPGDREVHRGTPRGYRG